MRTMHTLTDWVVEKRQGGWYFTMYRYWKSRCAWLGLYSSEASIVLMVARQLRKEIASRHKQAA